MPTTGATPAPFRRRPRNPNGLSSGGASSDTLEMPRERFLVDARLAQDPADGIPTEGLVERDDEEVRPIGVDQLPTATPLAFNDPSEPGHGAEEPPAVNLAGETHHSKVHRHDLGR